MDTPITRAEYEARNALIEQRLFNLENGVDTSIKELRTQVDQVKDLIQKTKVSVWQFIAITAINFLFDGGLLGFLLLAGHIH